MALLNVKPWKRSYQAINWRVEGRRQEINKDQGTGWTKVWLTSYLATIPDGCTDVTPCDQNATPWRTPYVCIKLRFQIHIRTQWIIQCHWLPFSFALENMRGTAKKRDRGVKVPVLSRFFIVRLSSVWRRTERCLHPRTRFRKKFRSIGKISDFKIGWLLYSGLWLIGNYGIEYHCMRLARTPKIV